MLDLAIVFWSRCALQRASSNCRAGKYRIVDENGSLHVERTELDDRWKRQYSFTLTPRRLDEFAAMCLYHQTSPESPFTRKKLCTLATADGRITLSDRKLLITQNGSNERRMVGPR